MTFTAADVANGNSFAASGDELILVQNTDTGAHHYSVSSVADVLGRTKDLTSVSIAAGAIHALPKLPNDGWRQSDGNIYVNGDDATVKFAVLSLPS